MLEPESSRRFFSQALTPLRSWSKTLGDLRVAQFLSIDPKLVIFGIPSLHSPTTFAKLFGGMLITVCLAACKEEEVRGVLVAKYADGSARFVKRLAISTIDGPLLSLSLTTRTKRCELIGPVPAGALSGITDCKEISGVASLRCEGAPDVPTRWQMTSCHSGYGRSVTGTEPAFLFGFSGNAYTAQDQLDLAQRATFDSPANDCQSLTALNPFGECGLPDIETPPRLREQPNGSTWP